ncbi:hypothetical protein [Hymenobacter monticola]
MIERLQAESNQVVATDMAKFNLFRLSCMLDDMDGAKFNKVLVSVVCDYIYQRSNERTLLSQCLDYVVRELGIATTGQHLKNVLSKVEYVRTESLKNDVLLSLEVGLYDNLCHTSDANSIEHHARRFLRQETLPENLAEVLVEMIHQSIYENIQGLAGNNVKALLAEEIKGKFPVETIKVFNRFLEYENRAKDNAIFRLFYKALEFAIVTSGKGVKDFTANLFKGKVYLLDTNVIFRLMGIDGVQEQANMEELVTACLHQGVEFRYTAQTYEELRRKREQAVAMLKRFNNQASQLVEDTLIGGDVAIQEGFANQYYRYKKVGVVATPEQYELKLMADFRRFEDLYKLRAVSRDVQVTKRDVEALSQDLFEGKKARRVLRYTGSAAQVDAYNILYVKGARAFNNTSFSDVKCFYLSTDRMLAEILKAEANEQGVSEVLFPAQAFLLHASLSANFKEADYITFTKFLKKSVVGQEFTGVEVVRYVNQVSSFTKDPKAISTLLKAYSDKRYTSARSYDSELTLPTFSEFARTEFETQLDLAHQKAEEAEQERVQQVALSEQARQEQELHNQQQLAAAAHERQVAATERDVATETLQSAILTSTHRHLRNSLRTARLVEASLGMACAAGGVLIKDRVHTGVLLAGIVIVIGLKLIDLFFSAKMGLMKRFWQWLFLTKVHRSDMYHSVATRTQYEQTATTEFNRFASNNLWSVKLE